METNASAATPVRTPIDAGRRPGILIAKTMAKPDRPEFWEVLTTGSVLFDPRPGWVLLAKPIGARRSRQILQWKHPEETAFEWIREFRFFAAPDCVCSNDSGCANPLAMIDD